ncbi:hypothetical protein Q7C36_013207 [Tachysurus vachellii]|uniref:Uncharacterized protein n=1 Tax=Tachysurus vachellii TaxID=175792 RepID=A0AA88MHW3_TACVA|nr:hypothetical protein Q7C36_013207 [Tachysurus vachellii]
MKSWHAVRAPCDPHLCPETFPSASLGFSGTSLDRTVLCVYELHVAPQRALSPDSFLDHELFVTLLCNIESQSKSKTHLHVS